MTIAFTLCSNNYLPHADVLCSSLKQTNPGISFVLGLVDDRHPDIDYSDFAFDEVISLEQVEFPDLEFMLVNYGIVELNTAVKPFFFEKLFDDYPANQHVLYFDPDIFVYANLGGLTKLFDDASILLVPHFSTPHRGQSEIITPEIKILQRGLYNLGFLGLKNDSISREMLSWWQSRLVTHSLLKPEQGMFVDQKWIDLVPVYFDQVLVIKKQGYDVAYWNLYEYDLESVDGIIHANGSPMVFYHFSAFPIGDASFLSCFLENFPAPKANIIRELYEAYRMKILAAGYHELCNIPWTYLQKQSPIRLIARLKNKTKELLRIALLT